MVASREKRPTIRDVAREAGVSYQTVSRVLNNQPKVSLETRKRVLETMERLGYQRNLAAQMLTTHRSQTLQIVAVDATFPIELHSVTHSANEAGYLSFYVECTRETLARTFDIAASRLVDGIYLHAPKLHIADDELVRISHGIPLVRRDYAVDSNLTWVGFDQLEAGRMIVQHLIDLGHCHIAEITGSIDFINPLFRHEAYVATLTAHGLEPGPSLAGDYSTHALAMKTGYERTCQLIRSGARFTALIVGNDKMAIGALHALREHNLRIPEDVSVASFDDAPHAQYMAPPLTVVEFDFPLQDRLVFQHLFERIENPEAEHVQHVLMPNLIIRKSTAPVSD